MLSFLLGESVTLENQVGVRMPGVNTDFYYVLLFGILPVPLNEQYLAQNSSKTECRSYSIMSTSKNILEPVRE